MTGKTISLADQAYQKIKECILDLTYAPGMPLTEASLTSALGMSRSPVRSALRRLQTEGLIETDYYKSMRVKEITEKDIREIYQLRELLESNAFHQIFASGRHVEYSYRLEEKVVRMCAVASDPYRWELADTELHMEIVKALQNDRITKVYENNLSELIRIGQFSVKYGMRIPKTNENLKRMVEYMRKGEEQNAYTILKEDHFQTGKSSALKRRHENEETQ